MEAKGRMKETVNFVEIHTNAREQVKVKKAKYIRARRKKKKENVNP